MTGFKAMRRFIFLTFALAAISLSLAHRSFAAEIKTYAVIDEVVPILDSPGGEYEILDGDVMGDEVSGIVVYGNMIQCLPADGKFAGSWLRLLDPESGGTLGFVPSGGLEPKPGLAREHDARKFILSVDSPEIFLMPGEIGEKYSLSARNFKLIKGDVVTAYGEADVNGEAWTLLGFDTSAEDGGDSGHGGRYAWARSGEIAPLDGYKPDDSRIDPAWLPPLARNYFDSEYGYGGARQGVRVSEIPENVRRVISERGFWIGQEPLIRPVSWTSVDDMADLYRDTGAYSSDFITTDIFFHSFHLIFDQMLENLEKTYLAPKLWMAVESGIGELTKISQLPQILELDENPCKMSPDTKKALDKAFGMFAIPGALIYPLISETGEPGYWFVGSWSEDYPDLQRAVSADSVEISPLTGAVMDYTQFKPRGHYTKSPEQEAYFRAMTWLGEASLPLFDKNGVALTENVKAMALIAFALDSLGDDWKKLSEPVDFLVGKPAHGAVNKYIELVKREIVSPENALDDERIAKLAECVKREIEPPKIRDKMTGIISREEEEASRLPEFRLLGKRFTFDAYVMNQLTSPRVGSDTNPRNLPEGTDVMAVLGSAAADERAKSGADGYAENLARLKGEWKIQSESPDTLYALWLRSLSASFEDSGSKQFFYRSGAWRYKKLLTASASWAEIKHDTILYGVQSGAEMGDGGWYAGKFAPPRPRGYVEPDPQAFAELEKMARSLLEFYEKFGLESGADLPEYTDKLTRFAALCGNAKDIARKEVSGEPVTDADYASIKSIAREWDATLLMPEGRELYNEEDPDVTRMAIVADVATDFLSGMALHAATGAPREILVYVNDGSGGPRIARGFVHSYYEFARPLADGRMNDPEWRKLVYGPDSGGEFLRKSHPAWYSEIYPGWE